MGPPPCLVPLRQIAPENLEADLDHLVLCASAAPRPAEEELPDHVLAKALHHPQVHRMKRAYCQRAMDSDADVGNKKGIAMSAEGFALLLPEKNWRREVRDLIEPTDVGKER